MNINIYYTNGANVVPLIIVLMYKTDDLNRMICVWTIIRVSCLATFVFELSIEILYIVIEWSKQLCNYDGYVINIITAFFFKH